MQSAATVKEIFTSVKPAGMTPIGRKMDTLLQGYLMKLEQDSSIKPMNYVVITDGAASMVPFLHSPSGPDLSVS